MLQQSDLSFARPIQFHKNPFEHRVQIVGYLRVPEADDSVSLPLEPKLPFLITLGILVVIVMTAVEFDYQWLGRTEEVHDIGPIGA